MDDTDIEAIRRNINGLVRHTADSSIYWRETARALLDAYEAERSRAERLHLELETQRALAYAKNALVESRQLAQPEIDLWRARAETAETDADQLMVWVKTLPSTVKYGYVKPKWEKALAAHEAAVAARGDR